MPHGRATVVIRAAGWLEGGQGPREIHHRHGSATDGCRTVRAIDLDGPETTLGALAEIPPAAIFSPPSIRCRVTSRSSTNRRRRLGQLRQLDGKGTDGKPARDRHLEGHRRTADNLVHDDARVESLQAYISAASAAGGAAPESWNHHARSQKNAGITGLLREEP